MLSVKSNIILKSTFTLITSFVYIRLCLQKYAKVITYDIIQPCPKEMVSSGLKLSLDNLLTYIDQIKHTISALSHLEDFRSEHEKAIIYHYIKKQYDDNTLPKHLEKEVRKIQLYFEDRRMETNKANLSFQMNKIVEKNNYCKIMFPDRTQTSKQTKRLQIELVNVSSVSVLFMQLCLSLPLFLRKNRTDV